MYTEESNVFRENEGFNIHNHKASTTDITENNQATIFYDHTFKQTLSGMSDTTSDTNAKSLLMYRAVLAKILQYSVAEFKNCNIQEVMDAIPMDKVETCRPINPDIVSAEANEQGRPSEKVIRFDLLFRDTKYHMMIDIEPQSSKNMKYPLEKRGIYHLSRMLSDQLKPEVDTDYGILHKCYSIWICFDTLKNDNSTVAGEYHYKMHCSQSPEGRCPGKDELNVDLLELIILRTGGPDKVEDNLLSFINALFRNNDNLNHYLKGLPENTLIIKEASNMCDIKEVGYNIGVYESAVKTAIKAFNHNLSEDVAYELVGDTLTSEEIALIKQLYAVCTLDEILARLKSDSL